MVETISSLKVLGPLLVYAALHGLVPAVFIPDYRKGKPYDTITPELLCRTFPNLDEHAVMVYKIGELAAAVSTAGVTALCLLNPYRNFVHEVAALAEKNIRVFGLDYFINSIYVAASHDDPIPIQHSLESLTGRLVASTFWQELECTVRPAHRRFTDRFQAVGSPLLDAFADVDSEAARRELRLPPDKPIVSIFTPNIRDHQAYFFYGLTTILALKQLATVIRGYCDDRGYYLVVKSRAKQWDAKPFVAVADRFVEDLPEHIYPSTSTRLLKVSSLALHFGSMMVIEAAGTGIPSIAFAPEAVDKLHGYMRSEVKQLLKEAILLSQHQTLMHWENVSESLPIWPSPDDFFTLADRLIAARETAPGDYQAFNQHYSGWEAHRPSSERILEILKHHV